MSALASFAPWAAVITLLACLGGQVLHGYLRIMHSNPRVRTRVAVYESALLAHIAIMAAYALVMAREGAVPPAALWANAAVAAVAAYFALADPEGANEGAAPRWLAPVEMVIACACTPAALNAVGAFGAVPLAIDVVYFAGRTAGLLLLDRKNRFRIVSPLSLAEALKRLPEGLLYADASGRTFIANDAMRRCLASLGVSGSPEDVREIWRQLNDLADGPRAVPAMASGEWEPGSWVVLELGSGETWLFSFEGIGFEAMPHYPTARPLRLDGELAELSRNVLGKTPYARIVAYDISEEIAVLEEIVRANFELSASQQAIRESAETVREAAENEAMLKMRGRVHDIIGQRLSILHRALEDNAISDEKIEQLKPLINGIMDDLTADVRASAPDELAATMETFALSGVTIRVEGMLPRDELRAMLFADCIREAATNAVKHARARTVAATVDEWSLAVSNDGMQPDAPIVEGTGLTNMRRAIEAEGGTFRVQANPFALVVSFPGHP